MDLLKNKKGQIGLDPEVFQSPLFIILAFGAVGMTVIGYILGKKWGLPSFPLWQFLLMIVGEIVASYFFAARG